MNIKYMRISIVAIVAVPFIAFAAGPFGKKPPAPVIPLPESIFGVTKPRGSTPQSQVGSPAEQMQRTAPAQTYTTPSPKKVVSAAEAAEAARLKAIKTLERRLGEDATSKYLDDPSFLEKKADLLLHNEGWYGNIDYKNQPYSAIFKDGKMIVADVNTGKPLTRKEIMAKLSEAHTLEQFSEAEANKWQGELMKEYDSYANQYKKDFEKLQQLKREQSAAELIRQRNALQGNNDFIDKNMPIYERDLSMLRDVQNIRRSTQERIDELNREIKVLEGSSR